MTNMPDTPKPTNVVPFPLDPGAAAEQWGEATAAWADRIAADTGTDRLTVLLIYAATITDPPPPEPKP